MTDTYGPRNAGSANLQHAIDFIVKRINAAGFNVWTEEVTGVPYWKRGFESVTLITPTWTTKLAAVGLGFSVSTPPGGISAPIIVVRDFAELESKGQAGDVKGKILVYNEEYTGYGSTVIYRSRGAVEAAKWGAVAALVKSITSYSIRSPHTGTSLRSSIPFAALSVEDANLLARLYTRHVRSPFTHPLPIVNLTMENEVVPDCKSQNVIVELPGEVGGRGLKNEVVLLGGHIDSWDGAVGAQDDGVGVVVAYEALRLISLLPVTLRPARSIRAVFFTAEEIGSLGGKAYFEKWSTHPSVKHIFLLESDSGIFRPWGLSIDPSSSTSTFHRMSKLAEKYMKPNVQRHIADGLGDKITYGYSGADISYWKAVGAVCVGWQANVIDGEGGKQQKDKDWYFRYHHSAGDTMDIVSSQDLEDSAKLIASWAYLIAQTGI